jgi:FkbM family methyltransferase
MEQYSCPHCGASDRDRLYACYLERRMARIQVEEPVLLLDIAPSLPLSRLLDRFENLIRHTADLLAKDVDFTVDVTNMPEIASDSYDALICSHVLEHVRDDGKALTELYRVLKPGGWAILMVPIVTTINEIDEDPDVTDEGERWRRFGQYDHVRLYSKRGFIERVEAGGFHLHQLGVDYFGESTFKQYGITNKSILYIGEKRDESIFKSRLFLLIEENSHYEFPKSDFTVEPVFDQPVRIVESPSQRASIREQAWERLHREYDVEGLEFTYHLLSDEYSKEMFVRVIAARLLGMSRSRLPLYYSHIWKLYDTLDKLQVNESSFQVGTLDFYTYDLTRLGFKVKIHDNKMGAFICFVMEQYKYKNLIFAREGDYVIDGGACYGDTALYFADLVKEQGKVFSFEFIDNNLELLRRNVALNPAKQNTIQVVESPLWSDSDTEFAAVERGAASYLTNVKVDKNARVYKTISIDEFVLENNIERVNFIKLDIEGAELETLKGAVETIRRYKPQLAVCLYHKHSDFWEIPRFLKELVPDYEFYFDHFALNLFESVLFATVDHKR